MVHPEYRNVQQQQVSEVDQHLTPIYASTDGLHQTMWRKLTDQALSFLHGDAFLEDYLPNDILKKYQFMSLAEAIHY
ncbi:ATP-dependent DNA helicase RecG, partial [bacterium]|nr:ATP-dependent DNA helicase RecG [bacterium]